MTAVLVVDDEPTLRTVVAELLRDEGYAVVAVGDGAAALAALAEVVPDLVLMDVMMPGMDGRAAYLAMRAHPAGAALPIVFASAGADPADLPADAVFLRKPFDLDDLLALVARLAGPP